MNPKTIAIGTDEYKKLEAVAKMLEAISPNKATYEVTDVYFDFGQNWMWTTICRYGYRECQILSPRDWNEILAAESIGDLAQATEHIVSGTYFADRQKGART